MRVAVIGGFAPSLLNFRGPMIRDMVRAGHEVLCLAPDITPDIARGLADLGASSRSIPLTRTGLNPLRDAATFLALWRELRAFRPQATFAYTVKPVVYGSLAAALAGVPARFSMITGLGFAFGQGAGWRRLLTLLVKGLYRLALSFNTAIFFQNSDDQALFSSVGIVCQKQTLVVTNGSGVDLDRYVHAPIPTEVPTDGPTDGSTVGSTVGLTDGPVFLCLSRLLKEKGVREFVEASELLKPRYPQARFRLVGPRDPGPDSVDVATVEEWKARGLVEVGDPVADVRPELAACTVYVLPSYREGTPRSVLEAMSTGRAVVTTDAPGCRETVLPGRSGLLVPPRDAAALARAMERFLLEPGLAATMGREGRALAEAKYDVRTVNALILSTMGLTGDDGPVRAWILARRDRVKRLFDLAVSLPLLLLLAPVLLGLAFLVRVKLGPGVFFRQKRPGLNGQPFEILKFRTMTEARDAAGNLLPDAERLPPFGRFLRASSLDELPELLNVVRGDMGLVGPRPLLMQYLPRYTPRQARRHEARPGITGWAQVNGRNAVSWEEKFELDVWYVEHRCLSLDLKILWMTVLTVLRREGITQPGQATAREFMGTPGPGTDEKGDRP
jgi:lipopolysaccharide/colanic/teichoic acid biosynthesis glycosyltransferase/glycosyltransferase involved in cell wall biosynthesis